MRLIPLAPLVLLAGCSDPPAARGPNILLISIDSLRADHLGCYGYARNTSPTIDRLAREGVRCETAISTTSWTLPAHAAMFTGLNDSAHGAIANGLALSPKHDTLAEGLREAGWQTAGFFGGPFLHSTYGLNQGFDTWQSCMTTVADDLSDEAIRKESGSAIAAAHRDITGPRTVEEVGKWLERADTRPFFLFVHLWDVHYDYIEHQPWVDEFDPGYTGSLDASRFMANQAIREDMDPRDLQRLIALYDGEIRWTDLHVQKILDLLQAKSRLDNTLVVLTADHGDEFFDHGRKGHQKTLFEEVIHVPQVWWWPGHLGPDRVVKQVVRTIDLAPTLCELVDVAELDLAQGRSLADLLRGGTLAHEPALSELLVVPFAERTLRSEGRKAYWGRNPIDQSEWRIGFDLARDPRELRPLGGKNEVVKRDLQELARLTRESQELRRAEGLDPDTANIPAELLKRLKETGYFGE